LGVDMRSRNTKTLPEVKLPEILKFEY